MGIKRILEQYESEVLTSRVITYDGIEWCELGAQEHRASRLPAKEIYRRRGVKHTSIDLTGDFGSLRLDLDYPMPEELLDRFDVVTNYGTSEHVTNQYQVFRNMHEMCKEGGVMIHGVPLVGTFSNHCRYYYTIEFFVGLGEACGYDIDNIKILKYDIGSSKRRLLCVSFKKGDGEFTGEFDKLPIYDSGDTRKTGDYVIKKRSRKKPKS